jgi:signal transduction histidine kinase/ActR/RegA family two-component response regulator
MRPPHMSKAEWNRVKQHHSPKTRVTACVRRHEGFGVICDIGPRRIPASVRNLEIDWDPQNQNAKSIPVGTYFEASVVGYDDERCMIILSRKAALPTPFDRFRSLHPVGTIVEGVVHEIVGRVIVRLSAGLEGVIPSDLIPSVTPPPDEPDLNWRLTKGDMLKAKIISYDHTQLKVNLDLAAACKIASSETARLIQVWKSEADAGASATPHDFTPAETWYRLSAPVSQRLTVLNVDNEKNICDAVAASLRDRGHKVITAGFVSEANRELDGMKTLDVALVDRQLLDGSGLDILRNVQRKFPKCRRLLFTGNPGVDLIGEWEDLQIVLKPKDIPFIIQAVEGAQTSYVHRILPTDESLGDMQRLNASEVEKINSHVRQVLDNFLLALQEPFGKAKIAILQLHELTSEVDCLRALDVSPSAFKTHSNSLRFSFIGNVLEGDRSGFHHTAWQVEGVSRDPLVPFLSNLKCESVYGVPLHVESQSNPMAVFAFLPNAAGYVSQENIRDFTQTARALALAIERATLDAQLFKHQRVLVAGGTILGMAHELRNQVQAMTALSSIDNKDFEIPDYDTARSRIQMFRSEKEAIHEYALKLCNTLESVLQLTHVRRTHSIELGTLMESVLYHCRQAANTDDVFLRLEAREEELSLEVSDTLQHCLMNLILNAIQHVRLFRAEHLGFVRVRVLRHSVGHDQELQIFVEDNAFGLDWSRRGVIFDPFVTTRKFGTGLGLSVARMIAESEGGLLEVESSYKYFGTTFVLRIPVKEHCYV